MRSLNYRQRMFVDHYLGESSGSAVLAARRAGYLSPEKIGPRLLKHPEIRAAIDAGAASAAMTSNEILARLAQVATFDLLDFIDVDKAGRVKVDLKLIKKLGLGHLIKRVRTNKDGTQDIELERKTPALLKLGEHFKVWKGGSEPQVTLVDVAKNMKERYEQWKKERTC